MTAAWRFLQQHRGSKSWISSEDAWYVTQSFYLLKIESETAASFRGGVDLAEDEFNTTDQGVSLERLSTNPVFGRTIGASSSVLACLSEINQLASRRQKSNVLGEHEEASANLGRMLRGNYDFDHTTTDSLNCIGFDYLEGSDHERRAQELHVQAFKVATVIHYRHTLDHATPESMKHYVSDVLRCLHEFVDICGGNYTFWPAFIAGVELYEETDKDEFLLLLENAASIGMNNRFKARQLIQQVWQVRSSTATETELSPGKIWVDWRQVMCDLEIDILLV